MMKFLLICFATWLLIAPSIAQSVQSADLVDVAITVSKQQGTVSGAYIHNWYLGARKHIIIGAGGRFTSYFGQKQNYVTAPAELTSGGKGPLVFFKENIRTNMDTLFITNPRISSINALINLGYQFNDRFSLGFNIDAVGFSFGRRTGGNYINGPQTKLTTAKPTSFNLLLISDNDLGTLNSELYGRYKLHHNLFLRSGAQFLFTEYTTSTNVQQFPAPNDRFRRKSLMFMIGISYVVERRKL